MVVAVQFLISRSAASTFIILSMVPILSLMVSMSSSSCSDSNRFLNSSLNSQFMLETIDGILAMNFVLSTSTCSLMWFIAILWYFQC